MLGEIIKITSARRRGHFATLSLSKNKLYLHLVALTHSVALCESVCTVLNN